MLDRVLIHLRKHKRLYIVGSLAAVAGFVWYTRSNLRVSITATASGSQSIAAGKNVMMYKVNYITADRQGPPSWVVRCKETGDVFTSQRSAALNMELPQNLLSEHLNGRRPDVAGNHFERLCLAA